MKGWLASLFFLQAHSEVDQLRRQNLFLRNELEMTRERVPLSRIFLTNEERERLLELDDGMCSDVLKLISIVPNLSALA